ncbi:MAG: hypothetical protein IPM37_22880 [Hahellaceae bacterium]|nr:hypothetical protein [Hahellaceae bacterium]
MPALRRQAHWGWPLPLPVGRLPQRLPLQLPSAEGLLGLNRRVSIVAPGNLQLTLLPVHLLHTLVP